jgi:GntR family transcriptional regulator
MQIHIDKGSRVPIYNQIKEQIKGLIHAGKIHTGDQLPTIRELSVELSVNFNTVALAYRDLANESIIVTERGRGTFVASTPNEPEMQRIRKEKLNDLVNALLQETEPGVQPGKVGRELIEQIKNKAARK